MKKIFRITDEFAHNYVICVTILCPTLTKMDTLIIQNKLRILRNGFQNSRNPFPILVILLFISFHFILDNHAIIHKKEAWSRGTTEVSGVGGLGINSLMLLGGTYLQDFAPTLQLIKIIWFPKSRINIFLTLKNGGGGFCPLVRTSPAISHRIILWSQNFLTLSIKVPSTR